MPSLTVGANRTNTYTYFTHTLYCICICFVSSVSMYLWGRVRVGGKSRALQVEGNLCPYGGVQCALTRSQRSHIRYGNAPNCDQREANCVHR